MSRSLLRPPLALALLAFALRPLQAQQTGELFFDEAVAADDVATLRIDLYDADVRLVRGEGGRVAVRAWVRAADDDRAFARSVAERMELSLARRGTDVEIGSREP